MNEYAFVRMSKPVRGTVDLPETDPLRIRYYIRAESLDDAYTTIGTRYPNEEVRCTHVNENVQPFEFKGVK